MVFIQQFEVYAVKSGIEAEQKKSFKNLCDVNLIQMLLYVNSLAQLQYWRFIAIKIQHLNK